MPDDFDDIVDIAVDEQTEAIENGEEVLDEDGKPFWMRYFKSDYLGESDPNYKKLLNNAGIKTADEEVKESKWKLQKHLQDELFKIKTLDKQLVNSNKVYKCMKEKSSMREKELTEKFEREKKHKKKELEK